MMGEVDHGVVLEAFQAPQLVTRVEDLLCKVGLGTSIHAAHSIAECIAGV